eukprot:3668365-Amphidinium_carterae.1
MIYTRVVKTSTSRCCPAWMWIMRMRHQRTSEQHHFQHTVLLCRPNIQEKEAAVAAANAAYGNTASLKAAPRVQQDPLWTEWWCCFPLRVSFTSFDVEPW